MAASSSSAPIDLHGAARQGDVDAGRKILEEDRSKINQTDKLNRTPLHLACWAGKLDFVKLLLEFHANVGAMAGDKFMALHFAAQSGNADICRSLLEHKAKIHAKVTKSNKTPLLFAASKGHTEVVRVLLEYGASVQDKTIKQETAKDLATNDEIRDLLDNAESIFKAAVEARREAKALARKEAGEKEGEGEEEGEEGGGKRAAGEGEEDEEEQPAKKAKKAPKGPISINFGDDNNDEYL